MSEVFLREGDAGICLALNLLLYLDFEAQDGVSTVGDILISMVLDTSRDRTTEDARMRTENHAAFVRMANGNERLCALVIDRQSRVMEYETDGLNAAVFRGVDDIFVVFRGTADGEWNDNGVALLGQTQTNAYYQYDAAGTLCGAYILDEPVSTQQAQALDYFRRASAGQSWRRGSVTVTGHSKGGNKAQLVALQSPLVRQCCNFCGQGFSPESLEFFAQQLGRDRYTRRVRKITTISSYNDFVNVLGECITPEDQRFFLDAGDVRSTRQYHELCSLVDENGNLRPQRERGEFSKLAERLWRDVLISPDRAAVSMAVMTLCQHYYGNGIPINGELIPNSTFYHGGRVAAGMLVRSLAASLWQAGLGKLSDIDREHFSRYYDQAAGEAPRGVRASLGQMIDQLLARFQREETLPVPGSYHTAQMPQDDTRPASIWVDVAALDAAAAEVADARQRLLDACEEAVETGGWETAELVHYVRADDARLQRCAQHLAVTAQEFERADAQLAALAGYIL